MEWRKYFSAGPNYSWHIDGHGKLKPFGFLLHGCIDGFSRRLIWLEVSSSNKIPEITGKFYLDAVRQLQSIPKKLKADDGTEYAIIQPIHILLQDAVGDNNSVNSFSFVPSMHNQRIEAYWSKLRQDRIGWWKDFFRDMVDLELFNPASRVLVDCLKFCFIGVLRKELKEMAEEWNEHIISKRSNGGPSGRPDTMYFLPHLFDCQGYSDPLEDDDTDEFLLDVEEIPPNYSAEFGEFAELIIAIKELEMSVDVKSCLNLYLLLLKKIEEFS